MPPLCMRCGVRHDPDTRHYGRFRRLLERRPRWLRLRRKS
jgi:hypothetical protein